MKNTVLSTTRARKIEIDKKIARMIVGKGAKFWGRN